MATVKQLKPRKLIRILERLPRGAQRAIRKIDHDAAADVLYLSFEHPQKATDSQIRAYGLIIHRRGKQVVGVTVLEASTR